MHLVFVLFAFVMAAAAPMMIDGAGDAARADAELLKDWTDDGLDDVDVVETAELRERDDQSARG